jgi:hypothetical protein
LWLSAVEAEAELDYLALALGQRGRMLCQAFEESFQVKEIQRSVNGLIAYDSPFVSFESVRFQEGAEKPVLQALEDLSKKLLLAKPD